ncbi:vitamin D 25-hydroxylase-like isoform X2 [Amphiura filiformis]|uniref:vitamin D 25-hydroxylase-like isoform X2 n=1 Tax=Amphiura filiformis TaxID=82378 RepID=UPI003B218FB3
MTANSIVLPVISGSSFTHILLLVVIVAAVVFFLSKKRNLPPGPWIPIPYIGFAPNIAYALYKGESLYKFLVKLGNKYGQVFSFTVLGIPVVVLNDYKAIREAFQDTKLSDRGGSDMIIKAVGRSSGTDTSSATLRWGSQYLVRYPQVQDRIHREVDMVVGRSRLPKLADKQNLPYTQAVIAELHRIISLVPLSLFHVAGDTTTFRGYTIPRNSVVISNLYAVMHSPELWGDPEEFRPERFLDDEGNFREPDEVIPFGVGRRVCLGEALARQELFIFFTHLLHQFNFEKTSVDAPMPTLKPIDGVVTHPEPYKLRFIKRE